MPQTDPHLNKTYGNVTLVKLLGKGAMGAVYQGWHKHFAREVAVKVLLNEHAKGNVKERFLREGRAAAKVHHEHVVQVMDAGEQDGVAYLVMELVNGKSLGALVDERGPLPCEAVARIGMQVALGLAAIHGQGILHRDIKPDNILIGDERKAKITDLGLAKQTDDPDLNRLTATGMVVGTPLYVSPEAIRDQRTCTSATDIYSLGATLYHLLVGHPPFEGESPFEVMRAHLEMRPRPLRELRPDIPAGLMSLVERCLHKSPDARPTALQVADLLSGGANLKANASRGIAMLVGIVTVLVLGGATIGWFTLQNQRHHPIAVQPDAQATARLTITTLETKALVRIDNGPWQKISLSAMPLTPGTHRIEVRTDRPGPLLRHLGEVTLAAEQHVILPVMLAPVNVPHSRIPLPGEGMLYVDGVAFGSVPAWTVTQAGSFALGRWSGDRWQTCTVTVDERGEATLSSIVTRDHPDGSAWWLTQSGSGQRSQRHHVACWWEVEHALVTAGLKVPPEWQKHGERSELPATGLPPELITVTHRSLGSQMAIPGRALALQLSGHYRAAVWCSDNGQLTPVGVSTEDALLILVPLTDAPAP